MAGAPKERRKRKRSRADREVKRGDERRRKYALLLIFASLFLLAVAFVFQPQPPRSSSDLSSVAPGTLRDRLRAFMDTRAGWYKAKTEQKIELDRARVEIENYYLTKPIRPGSSRADSALPTLDMRQEDHGDRPGTLEHHIPSHYPDAHVQTELRNRQDHHYIQERHQEQFIDDFLANARAAGYKVELDEHLNVRKVERLPQSEGPVDPGRIRTSR